jgi:hypothetical protein
VVIELVGKFYEGASRGLGEDFSCVFVHCEADVLESFRDDVKDNSLRASKKKNNQTTTPRRECALRALRIKNGVGAIRRVAPTPSKHVAAVGV